MSDSGTNPAEPVKAQAEVAAPAEAPVEAQAGTQVQPTPDVRSAGNPFAAIRQFVRPRAPEERCEMCGASLRTAHEHLVEPANRKLICVCGACAVLFGSQGETKYRRVPRRISFLDGFQFSDAQWEALAIPIGLAFFFRSSIEGRVVAFYPSPAGPVESLLGMESWEEIARLNPLLNAMQPDVEALLANRVNVGRGNAETKHGAEYYVAPIDECYRLVGLIRAYWRGLSGGTAVWEQIAEFFAGLRERSVSIGAGLNA